MRGGGMLFDKNSQKHVCARSPAERTGARECGGLKGYSRSTQGVLNDFTSPSGA
jgi:hypothetical protein